MAPSNSCRNKTSFGPKFYIGSGLMCTFTLIFFVLYFVVSVTADDESLLEFIPHLNKESKVPLIHLNSTSVENYSNWSNLIDSNLDVYRNSSSIPSANIKKCTYDDPRKKGEICKIDMNTWNPCVGKNFYNYRRFSPCIFIKFNEIKDQTLRYYNNTDELPDDMPQDLKAHIKYLHNPKNMNTVWVSCEGAYPADVENIGPIQYIPHRGFPGYFFPSENSNGYPSPLMAVYFERPMIGIIINIVCKAWAPDIGDLGKAHFELLIDQ